MLLCHLLKLDTLNSLCQKYILENRFLSDTLVCHWGADMHMISRCRSKLIVQVSNLAEHFRERKKKYNLCFSISYQIMPDFFNHDFFFQIKSHITKKENPTKNLFSSHFQSISVLKFEKFEF